MSQTPVDPPLPAPGDNGPIQVVQAQVPPAPDNDDPRALFLQLGDWGKYHAYIYMLSLLPHVLAGIFMVQNAFILVPPNHR